MLSDIFDKSDRSDIMRKVKARGNKSTELRLIQIFQNNGITGWRRNYCVKGHPDFVFPNKRVAIFVDGCFWHGHDCRNTRPEDNKDYWQKKRERNIRHDEDINVLFISRGWTILRIWECELKKKNEQELVEKLLNSFNDDSYESKHP